MSATEEELAQLEASVAEQGAKVRTFKKDKTTPKDVLQEAVAELKKRKKVREYPVLESMRRRDGAVGGGSLVCWLDRGVAGLPVGSVGPPVMLTRFRRDCTCDCRCSRTPNQSRGTVLHSMT
jgi:hypothetical protein